ncbi:hypothetical protein BH24ACT26_BH24ACT26_07180 [soil metagenome]
MDVFQCPACELRFRNAPELDAHLESDHPSFRAERDPVDELEAEQARRRHDDPARRPRPIEGS